MDTVRVVAYTGWMVAGLRVRTAALATLALLGLAARAEASGWLGDGTARFPDADPPTKWDVKGPHAWRAPMPSRGNATPVVFGELLCATSEPTTVVCVRRKDGARAWARELTWLDTVAADKRAEGEQQVAEAVKVAARLEEVRTGIAGLRRTLRKKESTPELKARLEAMVGELDGLQARFDATAHLRPPADVPTVGNASATPATDGRTLVAVLGNGLVAGLAQDGKVAWARYLPWDDKHMIGFGGGGTAASPLMSNGIVVVALGRLMGLDVATGATRWNGPPYRDYGTPALAKANGEELVLLPDGQAVRASDGRVLGKGPLAINYVGPVVAGSRVIFAGHQYDRTQTQLQVFDLPRAPGAFALTKAWEAPMPKERIYATPLVDDGRLFVVDELGHLQVFDLATGKRLLDRPLGYREGMLPSPVRAGPYVFLSNSTSGHVVALGAAPPFAEVASGYMGEPFLATPVFEGKRVYVRAESAIYCFEKG